LLCLLILGILTFQGWIPAAIHPSLNLILLPFVLPLLPFAISIAMERASATDMWHAVLLVGGGLVATVILYFLAGAFIGWIYGRSGDYVRALLCVMIALLLLLLCAAVPFELALSSVVLSSPMLP
jgi:hypothetical protein